MLIQPENFYTIHGTVKSGHFNVPENCKVFLQVINEHFQPFNTIIGFCLLPDSFLLLIKMRDEVSCEDFLKNSGLLPKAFQTFEEPGGMLLMGTLLKNALSKCMIEKAGIQQHKIEGIVTGELGQCLASIHLSPVKSGYCTAPGDWLYSSYNAYVSDKPTKIPREEVYELMGGKASFTQLHG